MVLAIISNWYSIIYKYDIRPYLNLQNFHETFVILALYFFHMWVAKKSHFVVELRSLDQKGSATGVTCLTENFV